MLPDGRRMLHKIRKYSAPEGWVVGGAPPKIISMSVSMGARMSAMAMFLKMTEMRMPQLCATWMQSAKEAR